MDVPTQQLPAPAKDEQTMGKQGQRVQTGVYSLFKGGAHIKVCLRVSGSTAAYEKCELSCGSRRQPEELSHESVSVGDDCKYENEKEKCGCEASG